MSGANGNGGGNGNNVIQGTFGAGVGSSSGAGTATAPGAASAPGAPGATPTGTATVGAAPAPPPGNAGSAAAQAVQAAIASGNAMPQIVCSPTRAYVWQIVNDSAFKTKDARSRAIHNYIWQNELDEGGLWICARDPQGAFLLVSRTNRLMPVNLENDNFNSWLHWKYGLNPTDSLCTHVVASLKSFTLVRGLVRDLKRFAFYHEATKTLYLSRYNGTCWKLDGTTVETVKNGTGCLFLDDDYGIHEDEIDIAPNGLLLPTLVDSLNYVETTDGNVTPAQQKLALKVWMFAMAFPDLMETKPLLLIEGSPGSGKCWGHGTPMLMFDGTVKNVEDVVAGDLLMGPDSNPRKVGSVTRGRGKLYRIVPMKGTSWVCNEDHILVTDQHNDNGHSTKEITVRDHLASSTSNQAHAKQIRTGVEFPARKVSVEPYLLGLWLGDGTKAAPQITNREPEIHAYCKAIAPRYGLTAKIVETPRNNSYTISLTGDATGGRVSNKLWTFLSSCVIADEKRIPPEYLINDRHKRLELLAGLLDTDGYYENGHYEIITKYKGLSDDYLYLCRSLGLAAYAHDKIATIKSLDFEGLYYRVTISGHLDQIPCKVARRKATPRQQIKDVLHTGFTVEPEGVGNYYGFTLDGDGRCLLGDFTITHNTTAVRLIKYALHGYSKPMSIRQDGEDDFYVQLLTSPIALLDNVDNFVKWLQDAVCGYVTGAEVKKRKLFTDSGEVILRPQAFIAIASANPTTFRRSDVADRCILIRLERRDDNASMRSLFASISNNRPEILGEWLYYLNKIVEAIRQGVGRNVRYGHRMADFAFMAYLVGHVFGHSREEVDDMLDALQAERESFSTENDVLVDLLDRWLETVGNQSREMNAADLHRELVNVAKIQNREYKGTPASLAQRLVRDPGVARLFEVQVISTKSHVKTYKVCRQS